MNKQENADFKIMRDGTWFHDGDEIKRAALAKLFSDRALIVDEDGQYWLKTPFEKYPVEVEDVPFVIVDYEETEDGLDLRTNMGEVIELGMGCRWELRDGIPYVEIRNGLYGRIGRSVLYNLIEAYGGYMESRGKTFMLGEDESS